MTHNRKNQLKLLISLEVQPLTQFPAPADCLPLFRFGFDLQPEVWEYFLMTDKTKILVNDRIECGFPGITEFHCVAIRGCCYDGESGKLVSVADNSRIFQGAGPECFWPKGKDPTASLAIQQGTAVAEEETSFNEDIYAVIRAGKGD